MEPFEPPKYIEKLIAAINDGAKSAQLGALAFAAIGLFLLATAFSATDEDLLLNRALTISQLGGTAVPVVFAFGLAPAVFVAAHFYTLIRYDMLAGNVRRFVTDLPRLVPDREDRDRCRQLLANVEFVSALVMPEGSRASSWMFSWTVRALLAVFPVSVLLVVQLQSLRLQSEWVTWTHHFCILADLVLLVWFFGRLRGDESWHFWRAPFQRKAALCWMPAMVLLVDLAWLQVPGPDATTLGIDRNLGGYWRPYPGVSAPLMQQAGWLLRFNPVDLLLCTPGAWGCRYLTVAHRVVVARIFDTTTFVALRGGAEADAKHRASFEPASLRGRTLRFADLTASELFAADLTGADLQHANFTGATLKGATLIGAKLQDTDLRVAHLQGADLLAAHLQGAFLLAANLQGANLSNAQLQGVFLGGAELQGARLDRAQLQGAVLGLAQLQGAGLLLAQLQGAMLERAQLQSAYLGRAQLQDANLRQAELQGAWLDGAQLQGASLEMAQLQGASLEKAQLQGASLRHVFAWRADARLAVAEEARIEGVETGRKLNCDVELLYVCDWGDFLVKLKGLFEHDIPDRDQRARALKRLEQNLDPAQPLAGEDEMAKRWSELQAVSPQPGVYEKKPAELWRGIGCAREGAPFVLRGLVITISSPFSSPFGKNSAEVPKLAAEFLKEDCAGARGISEDTRSQLIKLRDTTPQEAGKPDGQPAKP